jgi:hypothetical protein
MQFASLDRIGRGPQALFLELRHLVGEALALLADPVALRHPHVVEVDQSGVTGHHADLVDARRLHRHDDQALVPVRRALRGVGEQSACGCW